MASYYKPKGKKKYRIFWYDRHGRRRSRQGFEDKERTRVLAEQIEHEARQLPPTTPPPAEPS